MNKKILIGSIIAICILIGVSFTSVVGYNNINSDVKASPLFNIRSSRAIDEDNQELSCEYVGKGEESVFSIPKLKNENEIIEQVVDVICKMDGKTFSNLVARIMNQEQMSDKETSDVLQALYHIRGNPNDYKYFDKKSGPITIILCKPTLNIINCIPTFKYLTCFGSPFCIFNTITNLLAEILLAIVGWLTSKLTCDTPCQSFHCAV